MHVDLEWNAAEGKWELPANFDPYEYMIVDGTIKERGDNTIPTDTVKIANGDLGSASTERTLAEMFDEGGKSENQLSPEEYVLDNFESVEVLANSVMDAATPYSVS